MYMKAKLEARKNARNENTQERAKATLTVAQRSSDEKH